MMRKTMKTIWTITGRELSSYFDSLTAYVLLILFLGFSGLFTWLFGNDVFIMGQASLSVFFANAYWTLFFFIPALTMRLIADDRRSGTLELMLTKSVSKEQLILGKFFSAWLLIAIALTFTAPYVITVANIGNLDSGEVIGGYLGLILMSASYIGIGLFASSLTSNQVVAFLVALLIGLLFHVVFGVLAQNFSGSLGHLFFKLSMSTHFESISRGVVDLADVLYFLSLAAAGITGSVYQLSKVRING